MQQQRSKRTRVLLVEDERMLANVLVRILESKGYDVTVAGTLEAAHRSLEAGTDVLVLDVLLPDGNGLDLLERIRSQESDVRVAVITASYDRRWLRRADELRADAVLLKPFEMRQLLDWLGDAGTER